MITLFADADPEDTWSYFNGKLGRVALMDHDDIDFTNDVILVCKRDSVILVPGADTLDGAFNLWDFVERVGLLEQFYDSEHDDIRLTSDLFKAIDTYVRLGGFGGLSLEQYVARLYGSVPGPVA